MLKPCSRNAPLAACLLIVGLGSGLPAASDARAAFIGCRSDPIVIFSNGVVLDLGANIADAVTDVQSIGYTLHAPRGVSLLRSISTDGPVGYRERFMFKADSRFSGTGAVYEVDVKVHTRAKNVRVTATIAGGDAAALGITPDMVTAGAGTFTPVDANDARKPDPKGPRGHDPKGAKGSIALTVLPATVTMALNAWALSAPWAVTASATATIDKGLVAVVTL
jgi:hypothetical protein